MNKLYIMVKIILGSHIFKYKINNLRIDKDK